jgi:hypothetical protein
MIGADGRTTTEHLLSEHLVQGVALCLPGHLGTRIICAETPVPGEKQRCDGEFLWSVVEFFR